MASSGEQPNRPCQTPPAERVLSRNRLASASPQYSSPPLCGAFNCTSVSWGLDFCHESRVSGLHIYGALTIQNNFYYRSHWSNHTTAWGHLLICVQYLAHGSLEKWTAGAGYQTIDLLVTELPLLTHEGNLHTVSISMACCWLTLTLVVSKVFSWW